jgi:Putative abortive phage resistance protein AbiGi, antitoxin
MASTPSFAPGTVSRILWHFTGGPDWDAKNGKQKESPKSSAKAYRNLKSILASKQLRLGDYKEVVSVVVPRKMVFNIQTKKREARTNVRETLRSESICCLSDIPVQHLGYHAYRYGKFAIGFHREAAVKSGFNPVLYTLESTGIVRTIYGGLSELEFVEPSIVARGVEELESAISGLESDLESNEAEVDLTDIHCALRNIEPEANGIENAVAEGRHSLRRLLAFVKTFAPDEFSTIYCEREWRSLDTFNFTMADVAMVVLPRAIGAHKYFADFVSREMPRLGVPTTVPVVPWEDLVEQ